MVRVNEHAEKKVLSVSKMVQTDGNGKVIAKKNEKPTPRNKLREPS